MNDFFDSVLIAMRISQDKWFETKSVVESTDAFFLAFKGAYRAATAEGQS